MQAILYKTCLAAWDPVITVVRNGYFVVRRLHRKRIRNLRCFDITLGTFITFSYKSESFKILYLEPRVHCGYLLSLFLFILLSIRMSSFLKLYCEFRMRAECSL